MSSGGPFHLLYRYKVFSYHVTAPVPFSYIYIFGGFFKASKNSQKNLNSNLLEHTFHWNLNKIAPVAKFSASLKFLASQSCVSMTLKLSSGSLKFFLYFLPENFNFRTLLKMQFLRRLLRTVRKLSQSMCACKVLMRVH